MLKSLSRMEVSATGTKYHNVSTNISFLAKYTKPASNMIKTTQHNAASIGDQLEESGTNTRYLVTDTQQDNQFSFYSIFPQTHDFQGIPARLEQTKTEQRNSPAGFSNPTIGVFWIPARYTIAIGAQLLDSHRGESFTVQLVRHCGNGLCVEAVLSA